MKYVYAPKNTYGQNKTHLLLVSRYISYMTANCEIRLRGMRK